MPYLPESVREYLEKAEQHKEGLLTTPDPTDAFVDLIKYVEDIAEKLHEVIGHINDRKGA